MSWSRLDSVEKLSSQMFKKTSEARRARNRRAQAYLCSTLEQSIERNEAYEVFLNSLLNLTFLFSVLLLITVCKELVLVLK